MWMEVRGFWLIGIRVCLLLLLIKKILIAIVLIVITSNTLVQQIVKTIISQRDNRTNTRRNNVSKHSSAIDNPYNLGVIFSEEDLNRLLMPKSSSVPSDSSTFSVTDPVTELLSPSEDVSGMAPISQVSAQETGVPAMEIVRGLRPKVL